MIGPKRPEVRTTDQSEIIILKPQFSPPGEVVFLVLDNALFFFKFLAIWTATAIEAETSDVGIQLSVALSRAYSRALRPEA